MNNWFYEKFMIQNPEKIYYMSWKNPDDNEVLNFNKLTIKSSKEVERLGINIGNNLNLSNHIKSVLKKAGQKLKALLRISSNLNMREKKYKNQ